MNVNIKHATLTPNINGKTAKLDFESGKIINGTTKRLTNKFDFFVKIRLTLEIGFSDN